MQQDLERPTGPPELLVEPPELVDPPPDELLVEPPELVDPPPELLPTRRGPSPLLSLPSVLPAPSRLWIEPVEAVEAVALQAVSALGKARINSLSAFFEPESSTARQERSATLRPA